MRPARHIVHVGLAVLITASLSVSSAGLPHVAVHAAEATRRPNIVLIVTDDQRFDTLWAMPELRRAIGGRGVRFTRGFVVNPICCPSRASILTGDYSHSTGVYTNRENAPYGGFSSFNDGRTIATALNGAGYRTGFFGKYLNGYRGPYVPPGWDRWFATYDGSAYYDYTAVDQHRIRHLGNDPVDYGTHVLTDQAVGFIRTTVASRPLFAYVAPHAPHVPAIPAPGDGHAFAGLAPLRPPSFDETEISDKPGYISDTPRLGTEGAAEIDRLRLRQLRTLLGVDRLVTRIVRALRATRRVRDTLIVFTSDNGMLWGEHRQHGKGVPYEESVRVPFLVRFDRLIRRPHADPAPVLNIDLAPTFADAAGVMLGPTDGTSLLPRLRDRHARWRHAFLVEHLGADAHVPSFCAVRGARAVLVWYATGEREFYDLVRDPAELRNLAAGDRMMPLRRHMAHDLRGFCDPPPPDMHLPQ